MPVSSFVITGASTGLGRACVDGLVSAGAQVWATARVDAVGAEGKGLPPAQAARVIVRALTGRNPRPRQLIGADARLAAVVAMLPFRLRYRLTAARH